MSATQVVGGLQARLSRLEERVAQLGAQAGGGEQLSPNYLQVNPDGTISPPVFPGAIPGRALSATRGRSSTYAIPTLADMPSLKDYGAYCDLSHDDTAAIAAAIADIGQGSLLVPYPGPLIAGQLDVAGQRSIHFQGESGNSAGAFPGSTMLFTSTGSSICVNAQSSLGISFSDLMIYNPESTFTGVLVDGRGGISGGDSAYLSLERCQLFAGSNANYLLLLAQCTQSSFERTLFSGALQGVGGLRAAGDYSNGQQFSSCWFENQGLESIQNPGAGWTFGGCVFENLIGGGGLALATASPGLFCFGLTVYGCWFGDAGHSGIWIDLLGSGWTIVGNYIGGGAVGVNMPEGINGVTIMGNKFDQNLLAVQFVGGGGGGSDIIILGNDLSSVSSGAGPAISFAAGPLPKNSLIQYTTSAGGNVRTLNTMAPWAVAAAPSDAAFPATPPDGTMMIDTVPGHEAIAVRINGNWKSAALT